MRGSRGGLRGQVLADGSDNFLNLWAVELNARQRNQVASFGVCQTF